MPYPLGFVRHSGKKDACTPFDLNDKALSSRLDFSGVVNTNAKVDYRCAEYWDVPIGESYNNPSSPDSAPIVNDD